MSTPLVELAGKTLGIVGLGNIGKAVAAIAAALGMKVTAYTSKSQEDLPAGITKVDDLDTLFATSDVVTLHCPLTPGTRHLVNRERLALMKPTAILLNTSRGPLVDEVELAKALHEGRIAAAGVDVLEQEPPPFDCPLLSAPNCYFTPHIAWATREARERLMDVVVANVKAFLDGRPQNNVAG